MGTIIAKNFDFCYNIGNRQICIVQQQQKESGLEGRRLFAFADSNNMDGKFFQEKLNDYLSQLQKKGKKLQIEECDPDTNICQVDLDFSKLF